MACQGNDQSVSLSSRLLAAITIGQPCSPANIRITFGLHPTSAPEMAKRERLELAGAEPEKAHNPGSTFQGRSGIASGQGYQAIELAAPKTI